MNFSMTPPAVANIVTQKTGLETFCYEHTESRLNVLDFWQWAHSDLLNNALRGKLAEFIVASAVDALSTLREEWDEYDITTKEGLKIEVKSSAYIQSWTQDKHSKPAFSIGSTLSKQSREQTPTRKSDVYVFCVLAHQERATINPLHLEQWDFYVLATSMLNQHCPNQKTITLNALLSLHPVTVKYPQLGQTIKTLLQN